MGTGPLTPLLYDVPPSEGMSAVLARSATDLAFGARFSTSVVARVALPLADRATLRVAEPGQPYAPAYRVREVERRLGRDLELEVTPRYALNEAFALVGQAAVRDRAATRYAGTFTATAAETGQGEVTFDAASLGIGTGGRASRAASGSPTPRSRRTRAGAGRFRSSSATCTRGSSRRPAATCRT
jgi:hypothetical protein